MQKVEGSESFMKPLYTHIYTYTCTHSHRHKRMCQMHDCSNCLFCKCPLSPLCSIYEGEAPVLPTALGILSSPIYSPDKSRPDWGCEPVSRYLHSTRVMGGPRGLAGACGWVSPHCGNGADSICAGRELDNTASVHGRLDITLGPSVPCPCHKVQRKVHEHKYPLTQLSVCFKPKC